jgi:DNA-binding transcriptional MerR regulator
VATDTLESATDLSIDELAQRCALPVRTVREYQTQGLLPGPERRGRVGVYGDGHVHRLQLIARLQERGYSLAGIRDLLRSWRHGEDLADVLGLDADQLVHREEPGAPASLEQLVRVLPDLIPEHLADLEAAGVIDACGPDQYCVPSPSALQLTKDALAVGYPPDAIVALLRTLGDAADRVADAAVTTLTDVPPEAIPDDLTAFAERARPLLAHSIGRLTIHQVGKRLGIHDEAAVVEGLRQAIASAR